MSGSIAMQMIMRVDEPEKPEPPTRVRLGQREAHVPLARRRREALKALLPILDELEGKTVYVGSMLRPGDPFWIEGLALRRMRIEGPIKIVGKDGLEPRVIALRGERDGCVRIFLQRLTGFRTQEYFGYTHYILDFWNGFRGHELDQYAPPGYMCLTLSVFKD